MKNLLLHITLLLSVCGLLKSADQQYQFDDTDRVLFRVDDGKDDADNNERIGALYSTAFINSVSDTIQSTVDRNSFFDICESAIAQTVHHKEKEFSIPVRPPKGCTAPFTISLEPLKIGPQRIAYANKRAYKAYQSLSTVINTVTIKDKDFLLLLQFSIQRVTRNAADLQIELHPNLRPLQKTFVATQLLAQFMEKYRAYENKDIYDQSQE